MQTRKLRWCVWLALAFTGISSSGLLQGVSLATAGILQQQSLTPIQIEIEQQRLRLSSAEVEDRRDAVMRLGSMRHPEASRAALPGLKDRMPVVRATTAAAILFLPAEESAAQLIPLLADKDEFVRREAAYALGRTRSHSAIPALVERLLTDKQDEVRGTAAVALGEISDAGSISSLSSVLNPQSVTAPSSKKSKKVKREQNPFVLRSAARSLGQIGDRAGVPALVTVLLDQAAENDVRRESAKALGMIGDPAAITALRQAQTAEDPYLSQAADEAIRKIQRAGTQ